MSRRWEKSHFSAADEEPLGPMANLVDLMLVFACGLIAALIAMSGQLQETFYDSREDRESTQVIERGRELPTIPDSGSAGGEGYEAVGQVFRDAKTGKLILIGQ